MDEPSVKSAANTFDYSNIEHIRQSNNAPIIIQPTNVNFISFLPMLMKGKSMADNNDNNLNKLEDMLDF
jgi:hypothetical protein